MKKQIRDSAVLTALLWLCGIYSLQAQNAPPPDSLTRYKWEIGTDLLWLIDKNSLPPTSIFIRRHTKNGAWRLRVGGDFSKVDSTQYNNSTPTDINQSNAFLRFGYEFHKKDKNFIWFYGTDLHFSYFRSRYQNDLIAAQERVTEKIDDLSFGFVAFLGAKYFMCHRFSISGEASFQALYNSFDRYRTFNSIGFPLSTSNVVNRYEWQATFNPLYVLNLSYHF